MRVVAFKDNVKSQRASIGFQILLHNLVSRVHVQVIPYQLVFSLLNLFEETCCSEQPLGHNYAYNAFVDGFQ